MTAPETRYRRYRCATCQAWWMGETALCPRCREETGAVVPPLPMEQFAAGVGWQADLQRVLSGARPPARQSAPGPSEGPAFGLNPLQAFPPAYLAGEASRMQPAREGSLAAEPLPPEVAAINRELDRLPGTEGESLAVPRRGVRSGLLRALEEAAAGVRGDSARPRGSSAPAGAPPPCLPRELGAARAFVADELCERFCRAESGDCPLADVTGCSACGLVNELVSARARDLQRGAMDRLAQQVWKEVQQHGAALVEDSSFWMTAIELLLLRDDEFDVGPGLQVVPPGSDVCDDRIELQMDGFGADAEERRAALRAERFRARFLRALRAARWRTRLGRVAHLLRPPRVLRRLARALRSRARGR